MNYKLRTKMQNKPNYVRPRRAVPYLKNKPNSKTEHPAPILCDTPLTRRIGAKKHEKIKKIPKKPEKTQGFQTVFSQNKPNSAIKRSKLEKTNPILRTMNYQL